jgi:hypothetical protein
MLITDVFYRTCSVEKEVQQDMDNANELRLAGNFHNINNLEIEVYNCVRK